MAAPSNTPLEFPGWTKPDAETGAADGRQISMLPSLVAGPTSEHTAQAKPGPLGLLSFGMTTLMLNYIEADWADVGFTDIVVCTALFYGGLTQLLAGMWEMARGSTFSATAFSSYGAYWLGWGVLRVLKLNGFAWNADSEGYATAESLYLGQWGFLSFLFFLLSFKQSRALQFTFFTNFTGSFLMTASKTHTSVKVAGGYILLLCAASAIYTGFGEMVQDTYGLRFPGL